MSCAGQSKITDTICFPVEVVKKVLIAAEQKKVLDGQVILLNQRIEGLQAVVKNLEEKDSATVAAYNTQIEVMKEQKEIFQSQLDGYEKLLRKEKRKRFWTGVLGAATTAGATYLLITK
jgi:ASC-1-like (ASCH) protein